MDLERLLVSGDHAGLQRALDDAIVTIRIKLRTDKRAGSLRRHAFDYGFVRNLAGLGWIATLLAVASLVGALSATVHRIAPVPVVFIETMFAVGATNFLFMKSWYVHLCSERYAEGFFTTVSTIAASGGPTQPKPS